MSIHVDTRQARETIGRMAAGLSAQQIDRATARAINHTSAKARTPIKSEIRQRYNIQAKALAGKGTSLTKAFLRKLQGSVDASTRPIPLILFNGTKQTDKGVQATVVRGQRKLIKGAFITTTKAGKRGVFARGQHQDGGGFKFRHKRIVKKGPDMPIEQLNSVSIYTGGISNPVQRTVEAIVGSAYPKRFVHEVQAILKGITR